MQPSIAGEAIILSQDDADEIAQAVADLSTTTTPRGPTQQTNTQPLLRQSANFKWRRELRTARF